MRLSTLGIAIVLPALAACGAAEAPLSMRIETPAWGYGSAIPATYACDGSDVSPPLGWDRVPQETRSLILLMEDRDAGRVHWLVYGIPPGATGSPERNFPAESLVGTNDFRKQGYSGPCPESGERHRYMYRLFALDTQLALPAGATRDQVMEAAKGHIIARGELMGTYAR